MKRYLQTLCASGVLCVALAVAADEAGSESVTLDNETIAVIGGQAIPYDWFVHDFRANFFRHVSEPDVREIVFDGFLNRALVYEAARQAGVDQDPDLREKIEEQLARARSLMEFRLAMMERGMVAEHFLIQQGLSLSDFEVSDENLLDYVRTELADQPGFHGIESLDEIPNGAQTQLRERIRQARQGAALDALRDSWTESFGVQVNTSLVESVPLPDMPSGMPTPPAP